MTSPYYFREEEFKKNITPSLTIDVEDLFDIGNLTLSTQSRRKNPYIQQIEQVMMEGRDFEWHESRLDIADLVGDLLPFSDEDHIQDVMSDLIDIGEVIGDLDSESDKILYQYIEDNKESIRQELDTVARYIDEGSSLEKMTGTVEETLSQLSSTIGLPCLLTDLDAAKTDDHSQVEYVQCQYGDTALQSYAHDGSFVSLLNRVKEVDLRSTLILAIEKANLLSQVDALVDEIQEAVQSDFEKKSLTEMPIGEAGNYEVLRSLHLSELIGIFEVDLPQHQDVFTKQRSLISKEDDNSQKESLSELQSDTEIDDAIVMGYLGSYNLVARPYYLEGIALKTSGIVFSQVLRLLEDHKNESNLIELARFYASIPLDKDASSFNRYQAVMTVAKGVLTPEQLDGLREGAMEAALKVNNISFFRKIAKFEDPYKGIGGYIPFSVNLSDSESASEAIKSLTALKDKEHALYQNDIQVDLFSRHGEGLYLGRETMKSYHHALLVLGVAKDGQIAFNIFDSLNDGEQQLFLQNLTAEQVEDYFISGAIDYSDEIEDGIHESNPFFITMMQKLVETKPLLIRGIIDNLYELTNENIVANIKNTAILKIASISKGEDHYNPTYPFVNVDWAQHCEYIEKIISRVKTNEALIGVNDNNGSVGDVSTGSGQFLL